MANPTDGTILVQNGILAMLPEWAIDLLLKLPVAKFEAVKNNFKLSTSVARNLVISKKAARENGVENHDVMSLLCTWPFPRRIV